MNITFGNEAIRSYFSNQSDAEAPIEAFKMASTQPLVEGNFIREIQTKLDKLAALAEEGKVGTRALKTVSQVGEQLETAYRDYTRSLSDESVEDIQRDGYAITCLEGLRTIYMIATTLVKE